MAIWVNIYILLCKASGALPLNLRHCIVIPSPLLVSASTLKNLLMVKILLLVLSLHCLHSSKAFGQEPLKPFRVSHASIRKESRTELARNRRSLNWKVKRYTSKDRISWSIGLYDNKWISVPALNRDKLELVCLSQTESWPVNLVFSCLKWQYYI